MEKHFTYSSGLSFAISPSIARIVGLLGVPLLVTSPEQAWQHLMAFRNERRLHRRTCDASGQEMLSAYPQSTPFPVYKNDIWWGDSWNPLRYGRPIDFGRPFFPQLAELQKVVPREGTSIFNSENCEYNGHIRESKNCYMNSLVFRCEDTHYSYWMVNDKDAVDCLMVNESSLCYECLDCDHIYEAVGLQECNNCHHCYFSYQLRGCAHCIGCSNLSNASYCVENRQVTKEEYQRVLATVLTGRRSDLHKGWLLFNSAYQAGEHRATRNINCENIVGDHLFNSKNCEMAFDGHGGEDMYHTISFGDSKDVVLSYSAGWPRCELVYFSAVTRASTDIAFCYYTFFSSGLRYCDSSMQSHDCFGCIGLRHSRNCILNSAYTTHEYQQLSKRLIEHMKDTGEWGHFFPPYLSTFSYHDSAAQDYFPLCETEAIKAGFRWQDEVSPAQTPVTTMAPDNREDIAIQSSALVYSCSRTKRPYKVTNTELGFYKTMNLPPPDLSPDERHRARLVRRNPYLLWGRACARSGRMIYSSFAPHKPETVVSDEEFRRHVWG